ncbi:MAG: protein translocase subunit SecD [Acidimicrobiales bacterium]
MGRRRLLASVGLTSLLCFGMLALAVGLSWSPHLGLDLEGGLSVVYTPNQKVSAATLQNAANIMIERADALGVTQPNITTQGNEIIVQMPGVKNPKRILSIIGTTAQLYFRPVLCGAPAYTGATTTKAATKPTKGAKPSKGDKSAANSKAVPYRIPPSCSTPYLYTSAYYSSAGGGSYDPGPYAVDPAYASYPSTPITLDEKYRNDIVIFPAGTMADADRYVLGPALANGTIIKSAFATLSQTGQWEVEFSLTGPGTTAFNKIATTYYHALVANDLDGDIVSAPLILATSFPGSGQITGNFNQSSANALALDLNYGSLPVQLTPQTSQAVSPSLGKSSLHAGLLAGLLGLLLVMMYTIFYYRALGVVVVAGLVTTAAFLYGFISMLSASSFGLTLDLSGVTGLIVSVGITVDSYVVYFERLKDEVRAGKSVRASVDKGFRAAYRTILSADAVSFLGALVLWWLSVGAVRGFAFMLGLSTLVDVATAYLFTRPLVILLGRNRIIASARHFGIARGLATVEQTA